MVRLRLLHLVPAAAGRKPNLKCTVHRFHPSRYIPGVTPRAEGGEDLMLDELERLGLACEPSTQLVVVCEVRWRRRGGALTGNAAGRTRGQPPPIKGRQHCDPLTGEQHSI